MQKLVKSDWSHVSVGDLLIHQPLGFSYHKAVVCVVQCRGRPMVEDPIRLRVFRTGTGIVDFTFPREYLCEVFFKPSTN